MIGSLVQRKSNIYISCHAAHRTGDAENNCLGIDRLFFRARIDRQAAGCHVDAGHVYNRSVFAADVSCDYGSSCGHESGRDGCRYSLCLTGQYCRDIHVACQRNRHLLYGGDVPDKTKRLTDHRIDRNHSAGCSRRDHLGISVRCCGHRQGFRGNAAVSGCRVFALRINTDIGDSVKFIDDARLGSVYGYSAKGHGNDHGLCVAADIM